MGLAERKIGKKLALTTGTLVVLLALTEVGVRWFGPRIEYVPMAQSVRPDPLLGYRLSEGYDSRRVGGAEQGHVQVSEQGFRDRLFDAREQSDLRILALGDSYTYGHAVEPSLLYTEILEQTLQERFPERRVAVLNTGVPSWATFQQARLLDEVGPRFQPDLVLLQFCFNDLAANIYHDERGVKFLSRQREQLSFGGGLIARLARHSHAARLGFVVYLTYRDRRQAERQAQKPGARPERTPEYLKELCLGFVKDIQKRTEQLGAKLAILVVRQGQGRLHEKPPAGDPGAHFLVRFAQEQSIPVLTFSQAVDRAGVPFEDCSLAHFTARGHQVVAEQLFELVLPTLVQ
jgi:lysophospholipase L1-like esterase